LRARRRPNANAATFQQGLKISKQATLEQIQPFLIIIKRELENGTAISPSD
jgi:hypothetical protein